MQSFSEIIDELLERQEWGRFHEKAKEEEPVQTELALGDVIPIERYGCVDLYSEGEK